MIAQIEKKILIPVEFYPGLITGEKPSGGLSMDHQKRNHGEGNP
jgi:hypothetical protein